MLKHIGSKIQCFQKEAFRKLLGMYTANLFPTVDLHRFGFVIIAWSIDSGSHLGSLMK
jgi:hypothetical protein